MNKLQHSYHLPHNSIRIDEFEFMLNSIDTNRVYYTYDELRLHFLEKEIQANVFEVFHAIVHNNLCNNTSEELKLLYQKATKKDHDAFSKMLEHNVVYTERKSFRQVWNEFVRDYTEFFAFLGLLPTYYKGLTGGECRHYVTSLLREFQQKKISIQDLLFGFKFRNSSKNYKNLDMYHIEVRPFVLAIKALQYYRNKGITTANPHVISAIVTYSTNEFESFQNCLDIFDKPYQDIKEYKDAFVSLTSKMIDEIGRVTLFLKPYLKEIGVVDIVKNGNRQYYSITNRVNQINVPQNVAYCNGNIGKYKLTPLIGKVVNICLHNADKKILISQLFDDNFTVIDKTEILKEFRQLGIITEYNSHFVKISNLQHQYAINPFTDFMTYSDCCYVANVEKLKLSNDQIIIEQNLLKNELDVLKQSALSSDGTAYERTLYNFIKNNVQIFNNHLKWYGVAATGKRISDIACIVPIYTNGATKNILIVMECKAASAIRAFDERKEREDIINLLQTYKDNGIKYDGVWYWVTDSNSLPDVDIHGGYRNNGMSKSLIEKLNILQFDISEESRLPSIVTAFSIEALVIYLSYLYQKTITLNSDDKITESQVPHFWRWSKKFMNVQYVTIHKQMTL